MSEIYWITRLDGLRIFFIIAVVCAIIAVVVMSSICYEPYIGKDKQFYRKTITKLVIGIACSAMALVFLPTSNEALMIWGVGGSIDYLKANETAKQLPDKCIQALDAWVESINDKKRNDITMIQPNELRIGNWVKAVDAWAQVKGINQILATLNNGIKCESYMFRKIYPIPLTEDLLVQLGFPNEYATMYETSDGWFLHIDDASHQTAIAIPVKYLHELQNAYFVATKKELDVKL